MQNIPHSITEFLSEIILSQPNARYEICKSFRDRLEVPHQHIIVWNVWVVSTASHLIICYNYFCNQLLQFPSVYED